jgi:peptidoglycan/LPS O-acetylase OafA/YrhL
LKHDNNFDLLRLMAACQVFYMHGVAHLHLPRGGPLFTILDSASGVAVFFVISGFLVTGSWRGSRTAGSFFFKRALRIYPALIVNIFVLELLVHLAGGTKGVASPLYFIVYGVTASSDWATIAVGQYPYVPAFGWFGAYPSQVLWTLTVELTFYIALPIALIGVTRSKLFGLAILLCLSIASMWIGTKYSPETAGTGPFLSLSILPYFWIFAVGATARLYWDSISRFFIGKAGYWLAAHAVVTWASLDPNIGALIMYTHPTPLVAFRILVLSGLVLSAAFTFRSAAKMLRGHDLSYSLYLYHMLAAQTLVALGVTGQWWVWPIYVAFAITLAAASWTMIERPAMEWKKRLRETKQGSGTPQTMRP